MGEFAECLKGIKESCEFLNFPVVSGNVSFYNGTNNKNINPTPVIGGVGLISKLNNPINHKFKKENNLIILVVKPFGHLEQSAFLEEVYSNIDGLPPEVNLVNEKNNGEGILEIINKKLAKSVHDISSGGLVVALAEMSMGTDFGVKIDRPKKINKFNQVLFW